MTTISDLSEDLAVEILSKVPLTSLRAVRSTCKTWKALSKNQIFGKAATARKQFLGFTLMNYRVCSMKLDLQGICNDSDFVDPSIKKLSIFNQVEIAEILYCEGLLLCVTKEEITRLVLWNPYLGETRWIQPRKNFFCRFDMYALGYDNNNRNHKILRWFTNAYVGEIYDCHSDSWTVLDVTPGRNIMSYQSCRVSLKGNTYLIAEDTEKLDKNLFSFDFTENKFGPHLPLPSLPLPTHPYSYPHVLSCVRDEKIALLYETRETMEIWITVKIDPNTVSWSMFLKVDKILLYGYPPGIFKAGSFFIDEEKRVVVVNNCLYQTAYVIGEDGYFKPVNIGEAHKFGYYNQVVFSSYVPCLVQLKGIKEIIH